MSALRTCYLLTAGAVLFLPAGITRATDSTFGNATTRAMRPAPMVGIGVVRRHPGSTVRYCDDPLSIETRRRSGRVSDDQYHYDPYGHSDDMGYYARSYLDRDDGVSTRNPVSSNIPCSLSSVSAMGPGGRSSAYTSP